MRSRNFSLGIGGGRLGVDRLAAERVLADDMTDANSEKLLNFGRIQANGGL